MDLSASPRVDAAGVRLFHIPELVELILLSLPRDTNHEEISSMRSILLCRTVTRTWHDLIHSSTPLRRRLYLPTPPDPVDSRAYLQKSAFPPAAPNPWIPHLLLHQRSWGSAYPFSDTLMALEYGDRGQDDPAHTGRPLTFWTFALEVSMGQWSRCRPPGPWRDLLVSSPPFTDMWFTRSVYELGSGRAPFVTHLDYDPGTPKAAQRYRIRRATGIRVGDLTDACHALFRKHPDAKFVLVESVRVQPDGVEEGLRLADDRPVERPFLPGSSGEVWAAGESWH